MIKFKKSEESVKPTKSQEADRIGLIKKSASEQRKSNEVERPKDDSKVDGNI